ncbi:hypothetical protein TNCV_2327611 [Trichonephila clavipes]|nr:hypothetical protein TNCV_2327611 [Trichonephila clavipes]
MVLKANDRRTSSPCHDEFRGPRSDCVRQKLGQMTLDDVIPEAKTFLQLLGKNFVAEWSEILALFPRLSRPFKRDAVTLFFRFSRFGDGSTSENLQCATSHRRPLGKRSDGLRLTGGAVEQEITEGNDSESAKYGGFRTEEIRERSESRSTKESDTGSAKYGGVETGETLREGTELEALPPKNL